MKKILFSIFLFALSFSAKAQQSSYASDKAGLDAATKIVTATSDSIKNLALSSVDLCESYEAKNDSLVSASRQLITLAKMAVEIKQQPVSFKPQTQNQERLDSINTAIAKVQNQINRLSDETEALDQQRRLIKANITALTRRHDLAEANAQVYQRALDAEK